MNVFGIVAEYNPFHNGHKFQLEMVRNLGASHIIVVMSPNFTQRGEPSIIDKFNRAKAAIRSGVDLVLELPTTYALASAERFSFGAIYILNKLQVVDYLAFGAEAEDFKILEKILVFIESDIFKNKLIEILKQGYSFPKARQLALSYFIKEDELAEISKPNNILAIEYMKWLKRLKSNIKPVMIKRKYILHDKKEIFNKEITSALNLREIIKKDRNINKWKQFVPPLAYEVYKEAFNKGLFPIFEENGERAIISKLRAVNIEDIKLVPDISEGIENRIFNSINNFSSLKEIQDGIKTKRYTMSRIRRIIYSLFLDLKLEYFKVKPQYVRILAANKKGLEVISEIKKLGNINIDSNLKNLSKINCESKKSAEIEIRSTNIYGIFAKNILPCNMDLTNKFEVYF